MKKVLALILAIALLASLALPAMAAEEHVHSITIQETNEGHKYVAYQIFGGEVVEMDTDNDSETVNVVTLSNVTWGNGVDGTGFLAALKNQAENPNYYNLYASVPALNGPEDDGTDVTEKDQAAAVVAVLANNNTTAHANAFAAIAAEYLKEEAGTEGTFTEGTGYVLSDLGDGYYLVRDEAEEDAIPSEVKTLYILQLVKDIVMAPKDGEVEVEKKIMEGGSEVDACANNIGDVVDFRIDGKMPNRIHEYTTFYYEFYDTMSKGLTLDESTVQLHTVNGDRVVTVNPAHDLYEIETETAADGATILRVIIPDVLAINAHEGYSVAGTTELRVTYQAAVDTDAEIGNPGNPNAVKLIFSNDPYSDDTGETPVDTVLVFTFELDVTKVDGSTQKKLEGVEFVLYRMRAGQAEYAVVDDNHKLTGWTKYLNQAEIDADTTLTEEQIASAQAATTLATDAQGFFKVIGLDINATFYLKETKKLDGYEEIDDVEIVITGSYDETSKEAKDLKISVDRGEEAPGNADTGTVSMTVVNNPGKTLPTTGGVGTTMFYVFGGLMVAAALVLLVTKKRMAADN